MNPAFLGSTHNRPATGGGGGGGDTPFISSGHGSTLRDNFTGKIGFEFKPTANITVTHLGLLKVSGNSHTHVVRLYSGSTVLASATIDLSTGSAGDYIWQTVSSVSLLSGAQYGIVADYTSGGGDQWYNDDANITSTADGNVTNSAFTSGSPPFSNGTTGTRSFSNPNFQYTKP
jgi:hypothetical protein